MYEGATQDKLVNGKYFTLVDALDDTIDMWHYGRTMFGGVLPLHNSYIPVKHTIMPKPNLVDKQHDDLQFRFGNNNYDGLNMDPTTPHNPLASYKMTQLKPIQKQANW